MEKTHLKYYGWFEVALIIAIIRFILDYSILLTNYFTRTNWNSGVIFIITNSIINALIFYYLIIYFRKLADINQHNIFRIALSSLLIIYTLNIIGFVFLHYYLDTSYKHDLANIAVERHIERSRQIQEDNHIVMDDDSEMVQIEALKQYKPQQIAIDYVLYITWALLLSAIISSIYKNIYYKQQDSY